MYWVRNTNEILLLLVDKLNRTKLASYLGMYLLVFLHDIPVTERGWAR